MMATTTENSSFPPILVEALGYMQRPFPCPEEVKMRISSLRVPVDNGGRGGGRFNTNWRNAQSSRSMSIQQQHHTNAFSSTRRDPPNDSPQQNNQRPEGMLSSRITAPSFGNRAKEGVTVEERMMDRIRGKLNKFAHSTYDKTKIWLSQLLDSGETDFLSDFIALVFEMAATDTTPEHAICNLYAKLVSELRSEFPHFNTELVRIFREFMAIFEEARGAPETNTKEYSKFVQMNERRKYRRGYSRFLGEISQNGVIPVEDVFNTVTVILNELVVNLGKEEQKLLCSELAECLVTIVSASKNCIGVRFQEIVDRAKAIAIMKSSPSFSNTVMFRMMDIADMAETQ